MKCPKCGGDIPFYDLKPNCRHCGVNILYYTQDYLLERDAKKTELESAVARMLIARIKAVFVGSLLAIFRMAFIIGAVCALMIPFCSVTFKLPFYEEKFTVGLIGIIQSYNNGLLMGLMNFFKSPLFSSATLGALVVSAIFALLAVIDIVILVVLILSFLKPDKTAKILRNASVAACIVSVAAQIAVFVCNSAVVTDTSYASFDIGFGAAACLVIHLALVFINARMIKKGVEPTYREFDPKRKELLKKVKSGEVNLDDLSLPIFESEEEYKTRMKEFEQAMEEEAAAELENELENEARAREEEANTK